MNTLRPLFVRQILPPRLVATPRPRHRAFFLTPPRAGIAITNPRPDPSDPSSTMSILLTQRAAQRLKHIQENDANPSLALRITVEAGGCHGFQYTIRLSDTVDAVEAALNAATERAYDIVDKRRG